MPCRSGYSDMSILGPSRAGTSLYGRPAGLWPPRHPLVESLQCAGLIAPSWLQQLGTKTTPSTGPGTAVLFLGAQQMSLSLPYFLFLQLFMSHWQFFLHCSGHTGSLGSGFKILLILFRSDCQWMSYSLPLTTPACFTIFVDSLPPLCGRPAAYTSPVCLYATGLSQMSSSSS